MFEGLISEDKLDDILGGNLTSESPKEKKINYILIRVKDTPLENTPDNVKNVAKSLLSHNIILESIFSSHILVTIGAHDCDEQSVSKRRSIVEDMLNKYRDIVSIAHGDLIALIGLYGANKYLIWGSIIPGFSEIIAELNTLEFGKAIEIN